MYLKGGKTFKNWLLVATTVQGEVEEDGIMRGRGLPTIAELSRHFGEKVHGI